MNTINSFKKTALVALALTLLYATAFANTATRGQKIAYLDLHKKRSFEIVRALKARANPQSKAELKVELSSHLLSLKTMVENKTELAELRIKAASTLGQVCRSSNEWACQLSIAQLSNTQLSEFDAKVINIAGRTAYPETFAERKVLAKASRFKAIAKKSRPSPLREFFGMLGFYKKR